MGGGGSSVSVGIPDNSEEEGGTFAGALGPYEVIETVCPAAVHGGHRERAGHQTAPVHSHDSPCVTKIHRA